MNTALDGLDNPSASSSLDTRQVAFYDVDGTLIKTNVVHVYAYYAANHPELVRRVSGLTKLIASIPAYLVTDYYSRKVFNEWFYKNYEGFSEDRLIVLGEEIFDAQIIGPFGLEGGLGVSFHQAEGRPGVAKPGLYDFAVEGEREFHADVQTVGVGLVDDGQEAGVERDPDAPVYGAQVRDLSKADLLDEDVSVGDANAAQ